MQGIANHQIPPAPALETDKGPPAIVIEHNANSAFVVVCEHAGFAIPEALESLGLSSLELESHIAWDPGAALIAEMIADELKGTLIKQRYSRLVYDCNRPPTSADAMREKSEKTAIPGNQNLSDEQRQWRTKHIYQAFHDCVAEHLDKRPEPILVTIHSFTPVYNDQVRSVGIGILHDSDSRLADGILVNLNMHPDIDIQRNQPYGPQDGVTHTLQIHGIERRILNVMIEIRNDLIADKESQGKLSKQLSSAIRLAVEKNSVADTSI